MGYVRMSIDPPKVAFARVRKEGRLALYRAGGVGNALWESNWLSIPDDVLRHALRETTRLGAHRSFFREWLPQEGVVVEAGCGTGLWVVRLRQNGWNCLGVDYALEALERTRRICGGLPILCGDLRALPFADNSIAAYVSFGVVEHLSAGPGQLLIECQRVLRPGGIALISVPYDNWFRRKLPVLHPSQAAACGLEFYQFYFTLQDFSRELEKAGLRPTNEFHGYGVNSGLSEGARIMRGIIRRIGRLGILLDFLPGLPKVAAHMMFTAGVKAPNHGSDCWK